MLLSGIYNFFRIIFILADVFLFSAVIFSLVKSIRFRPQLRHYRKSERKILTLRDEILKERCEAVLKRFSAGTAEAVKLAVIEADKLADDILKRFGLEGEHMADRLEQLTTEDLESLERLWRAHRFRNRLVHEPDFELHSGEAEQAIADYKAFFGEVGII